MSVGDGNIGGEGEGGIEIIPDCVTDPMSEAMNSSPSCPLAGCLVWFLIVWGCGSYSLYFRGWIRIPLFSEKAFEESAKKKEAGDV